MKRSDRLGDVDLVEPFIGEQPKRFVFSPEVTESTTRIVKAHG
jgi:hypothetical protein